MTTYQDLFNSTTFSDEMVNVNELVVFNKLDITGAELVGLSTDEQTITYDLGILRVKNNGITTQHINNNSITNDKLFGNIDAIKIYDGTISNTEFGHLNGITSNIQVQFDNLNIDVSNLQNDVGDLQNDVTTLQNNVGNLQNDVSTLQTNVGNLQNDVGNLQTDVGNLQYDLSLYPNELKNLTSNEILQLQNINNNTISTSNWQYVGNLNQNLSTSSTPTFHTVNTTFLNNSNSIITLFLYASSLTSILIRGEQNNNLNLWTYGTNADIILDSDNNNNILLKKPTKCSMGLYSDNISELTNGSGIICNHTLKSNDIQSHSGLQMYISGNGKNINISPGSGAVLSVNDNALFNMDIIGNGTVYCDNFLEKTTNNGISIDNFLIKDGHFRNTCCYAYQNTSQSIPDSIWTTINFPAEAYDYGNFHDNTTFNQRLTVPSDGVYMIIGALQIQISNNNTVISLGISKNNSTDRWVTTFYPKLVSSFQPVVNTVTCDPAVAGNYYQLQVYQESGGTLNIVSGARKCFFQIIKISN